MSILEVTNLVRTYATRTGFFGRGRRTIEAVKGVSFGIEPGETFGLLGPNGAGKTTIIKILATLLLPTSGTVTVLGHDVTSDPRTVRRRVGYVFGGDRGLYDRLSARDNLRYFAELYGLSGRVQRTRISELLDMVGLEGRHKERVERFSRGMRQRLHIARGLLHDPDVILLDEPTIGIDPVGSRDLRATISNLAATGKTILLTTHYMFEADELCDRIAVIRNGEIVADGRPDSIKARVPTDRVLEVETFGLAGDEVQRVRRLPGIRGTTVEDRGPVQMINIRVAPGAEVTQSVMACLSTTRVGRFVYREPTLEDAYVELVTSA